MLRNMPTVTSPLTGISTREHKVAVRQYFGDDAGVSTAAPPRYRNSPRNRA